MSERRRERERAAGACPSPPHLPLPWPWLPPHPYAQAMQASLRPKFQALTKFKAPAGYFPDEKDDSPSHRSPWQGTT